MRLIPLRKWDSTVSKGQIQHRRFPPDAARGYLPDSHGRKRKCGHGVAYSWRDRLGYVSGVTPLLTSWVRSISRSSRARACRAPCGRGDRPGHHERAGQWRGQPARMPARPDAEQQRRMAVTACAAIRGARAGRNNIATEGGRVAIATRPPSLTGGVPSESANGGPRCARYRDRRSRTCRSCSTRMSGRDPAESRGSSARWVSQGSAGSPA
jgi:hypothetical protein